MGTSVPKKTPPMKSILAVLGATSIALAAPAAAPLVDLGDAKYQGFVDEHNITNFLGIRYAAAPTGKLLVLNSHSPNSLLIGDLRWRAPVAPATVSDIQLANCQPARCSATANPILARRHNYESEDCLFLNVYSASLTPTKLLPTIVWIHGGGYALGSASDYNGTELVLESNKNAVVVILQYRLGLFGFLAGNEVHEDGAANAGLLDQEFALRWVNKNIEKFGGDPHHVIIWGESAGAGSVIQHMLANSGNTEPQLFRAAITSSTYIPPQYLYDHSVPQALFDEVAERAGCPNSTALACLRGIDAGILQNINNAMTLSSYFGTFTFIPVVDGTFIVENPIAQLSRGQVNGEAYYAVTNTNEGIIFVDGSDVSNATAYSRDILPTLSVQRDVEIAQLYASFGSPVQQAQAIMKELVFVCPSFYALAAFPGKSYKAQFAIPPALHGDDVSYYLPSFDAFGTPTPRFNNTDFIDAFVGGFLSFAVNGNPNDKLTATIAPTWPVWSNAAAEELVFNETEKALPEPAIEVQQVDAGLLERCEFWKQMRIAMSL
uniref:Carboxylic ester hydrolase n=1 Tax=Mycena chlorophos TaxID=658473 RepID=A0ABQ0L6H5_MYCCL|nr:predicted protein [Mycena chlorophos]